MTTKHAAAPHEMFQKCRVCGSRFHRSGDDLNLILDAYAAWAAEHEHREDRAA